jgi:catechol 2,3-dioxygenase-like lactoylglutathione lyase family enzyme
MLESSDLVAFVAATDLDRARVFYEQTLGLRVLEHSDFAVVLDANGTMLRVTAFGQMAHPGYTLLGSLILTGTRCHSPSSGSSSAARTTGTRSIVN